GVLLGCNLLKFKSANGKLLHSKRRLFTILVSSSMHLIWHLRNERQFSSNPHETTSIEIHNHWVDTINLALKRDCLLANKFHFGRSAFERQMVLNMWSGTLWEEDALPDDWIQSDRVLVGIQLLLVKHGIG
ncbi:hypothetical protein C8R45DRAFT_817933, partial [Mycena sanguinolenta]